MTKQTKHITKPKKEPVKIGRPIKVIDFDQVDKLCALQCNGEEIAAFLDIDYDTLNIRCKEVKKMPFSDYFRIKRQLGFISLRRRQWTLAESYPAMAIFLGKNYLGQSDKQPDAENNDKPTILRDNLPE